MINVKRFYSFSDFYAYNSDFMDSNRMLNTFLIRQMNEVLDGKTEAYNFFNIEDTRKTHLIVLIIPDLCLIYANQYYSDLIPFLSKEIEFHRFLRFTFAGTKSIIENLLEFNNARYSIKKHLIIYKCDKVSINFKYSSGNLKLASINDLDSLIRFHISFIREYYKDEKDFESAKDYIIRGIENKNLYTWQFQNQLCSVAQVISREKNDYPEISHVYTEPRLRKQGFAPSLVHSLTDILLKNGNEKCMLYTNGNNSASNRAFRKIGYAKTGEYILCFKEK